MRESSLGLADSGIEGVLRLALLTGEVVLRLAPCSTTCKDAVVKEVLKQLLTRKKVVKKDVVVLSF